MTMYLAGPDKTTIEAGKTYRVTHGRGSQLFHVVRISKVGKPFGFRLNGAENTWSPSSLRTGDARVQEEWLVAHTLDGKRTIAALPSVNDELFSKAELNVLKSAIGWADDDVAGFDATNPFPKYPSRPEGVAYSDVYDSPEMKEYFADTKDFMERKRPFTDATYATKRALASAKVANTLVSRASDLTTF